MLQPPKYIPGGGNPNAKLMIVAQTPGYQEVKLGQTLIGPTGKMVREMIEAGGMSWDNVWRTNVLKYMPPNDELWRFDELGIDRDKCIEELKDEIIRINPNVLLCLGELSLSTVTGKHKIGNYRGSILSSVICNLAERRFYKAVPTIHPAALFKQDSATYKYSARTYIEADFRRAIQESNNGSLDLPNRVLEICRTSTQFNAFLDRYKDYTEAAIDIEAYKCIPIVVGIAFTPHHSLTIPLVDTQGILIGDGVPLYELREFYRILQNRVFNGSIKLILQNGKYDQEKLETTSGFKVPDPYWDTALAAHTIYPELLQKLQFLTSIYTREPFYKEEGKLFNPKKDNPKQLFEYNGKDCCVTKEIKDYQYKELVEMNKLDWFFNGIMPRHARYRKMESVGFALDLERKAALKQKYEARYEAIKSELNELAGFEVNVNSPKDVKLLLFEVLELPRRDSTKDDILTMLLANHCKDDRSRKCVGLILEGRGVRKTITTYVNSKPDYDGRCRTNVRIAGTEHGRSSNSKLEAPIRPVKKGRGIGLGFQNITKHGNVGADVRTMLRADEGYEICEADKRQAEAWIVAHLSDDTVTKQKLEQGVVHEWTSSFLLGIPESNITKEARFIGKQCRYAAQYGSQKARFTMTLMKLARKMSINVHITEAFGGQLLNQFHKYTPKIREVYHESVKKQLADQKNYLYNGYGRPRLFMDRWGDDLFRQANPFIPSSSVIDSIHVAWDKIWKVKYIPIVAEIHDALVFMWKIEEREENIQIIREFMTEPIPFVDKEPLVIPVDFSIGTNFGELKKYNG